MMNIGVFYGICDENDAEHTYEVLENEAHFYNIPTEKLSKEKIAFNDTTFFFINVEKKDKILKTKIKFDKIYLSQDLKDKYEELLKPITKKIEFNNRPSQTLIDYVKDIEHYIQKEKVKGYELLNNQIIEVFTEPYRLDKGVYYSSKEECEKRMKQTQISVITDDTSGMLTKKKRKKKEEMLTAE